MGTLRFFVSPNTINQVNLHADKARTTFLFQFLRQLARIRYGMSGIWLAWNIINRLFLRAVITVGSTPTTLLPSDCSAVLLDFSR